MVYEAPLPFFAHFWSQLIPSPPFYGTFGKRWGEEPRGSSALIFHIQWLFYSNTLLYINFQTSRPAKSVSPKMFPRPACQMNGLQHLEDKCSLAQKCPKNAILQNSTRVPWMLYYRHKLQLLYCDKYYCTNNSVL